MIQNDSVLLKIKQKCESIFRKRYFIFNEDVIYDAMLSIILQYNKSSASINNLDVWINGAVHNHYCIYILQKKQAERYVYDEFILDNIANDEHPESKVDLEFVRSEINKLERPYKEILELRLFSNNNLKEIAELLNLNEATVRKYYSRALEKLEKKIKLFVTLFLKKLLY